MPPPPNDFLCDSTLFNPNPTNTMKTKLIALLSLITSLTIAHEGVELGPNGGRIIELSKNETLHGEVIAKKDSFHITLLDKDMKPVALADQTLTATTGERRQPVKLDVTKDKQGFVVPLIKAGDWLILQFKGDPKAKTITARLEYNTSNCDGCDKPEWLCQCHPEK
jgi:hypothetical protein